MVYNLDHAVSEEPTGLYADPRGPEEEEPRSGRLLRITGALAVMAVFAGGLWFAYHQGLHHAGSSADRGEIPLVHADTAPFKVKPEKPGGLPIPDRDMLIYGEQHPQVEHLLPPPEQPMARPMPPPPPPPQPATRAAPPPSPGPPPQQATIHPAPPPVSTSPEQLAAHPEPLPSPSGLQAPQLQAPSAAVTQPAAPPPHADSETASVPPAARSQPAPDLIGQKIEQLEAAAASRTKRTESGRSGGLRLQLGSMRSESEARGAWERLKRANTDLLGNMTGAAMRADLGGKGIYYRIETGPIDDPAAAARICSELHQRHLACMIVH